MNRTLCKVKLLSRIDRSTCRVVGETALWPMWTALVLPQRRASTESAAPHIESFEVLQAIPSKGEHDAMPCRDD